MDYPEELSVVIKIGGVKSNNLDYLVYVRGVP